MSRRLSIPDPISICLFWVAFIGGDNATAIAKTLDDPAIDLSRTQCVGMEVAYDKVLATTEGQRLRESYDRLGMG